MFVVKVAGTPLTAVRARSPCCPRARRRPDRSAGTRAGQSAGLPQVVVADVGRCCRNRSTRTGARPAWCRHRRRWPARPGRTASNWVESVPAMPVSKSHFHRPGSDARPHLIGVGARLLVAVVDGVRGGRGESPTAPSPSGEAASSRPHRELARPHDVARQDRSWVTTMRRPAPNARPEQQSKETTHDSASSGAACARRP